MHRTKTPTRLIATVILGLLGMGVLVSLGVWQVQRLAWKQGVLAEIRAEITAAPVPLPEDVQPQAHKYLPVTVKGTYKGPPLRVLVSQRLYGAGYRLVSAFETIDGRVIMVDRGFVSIQSPQSSPPHRHRHPYRQSALAG